MFTLLESLYGLLSYITEDGRAYCEKILPPDMMETMDKLCTQLGEWLDENK